MRSWKDEISNDDRTRFFYIMIKKYPGKISVIVRGVKEDLSKLYEINILNFDSYLK